MPAKRNAPRRKALARTPKTRKPAAPKTPKAKSNELQQRRLWLMYPPRLITTPVIWQMSRKFELITNVRQASVTDEIGLVCLELDGARSEVKRAIRWLEQLGISVEPVEINVIES